MKRYESKVVKSEVTRHALISTTRIFQRVRVVVSMTRIIAVGSTEVRVGVASVCVDGGSSGTPRVLVAVSGGCEVAGDECGLRQRDSGGA